MGRNRKQVSYEDLLENLANNLNRVATRPDANSYKPHRKQVIFHSSAKKGKLYIGGNRSGKTVGGVVEDIWRLKGEHPYRPVPPPPIRGRLVCVDFPNGWEKIVKPVLQQWTPPSLLINGSWFDSWNGRTRTLTLSNGSFLEIMSYDQELDAFAGASRHFTHFDEEPPKAIHTECLARLIDTGGEWYITMTPVEGMTWVFDDIYEPVMAGIKRGIEVIEVDMTENTYLANAEIEDFLESLGEDERKARKEGKFVQIGGLIFKQFDPSLHVLPALKGIPTIGNNRLAGSMDHGFNNPSAFLWHLVTPNNVVITFHEHYRSEWTVAQHSDKIDEIIRESIGARAPFWADPATKQRNAINGNSIQLEYRQHGIQLIPSNNDVKAGLARMLNYQKQGRWFITENCVNLIKEMRRYRWKTRESKKLQEKHGNYDEPHKKDDHAVDAARYFFMSLPELTPFVESPENTEAMRHNIFQMLQATKGVNVYTGQKDRITDLNAFNPMDQYKITTDEFMGGEW